MGYLSMVAVDRIESPYHLCKSSSLGAAHDQTYTSCSLSALHYHRLHCMVTMVPKPKGLCLVLELHITLQYKTESEET